MRLLGLTTVAILASTPLLANSGSGYDSGSYPTDLVRRFGLDSIPATARIGEWLRIRDFVRAPVFAMAGQEDDDDADGKKGQHAEIVLLRQSLALIKGRGYRSLCVLHWGGSWNSGSRSARQGINGAPLDLREAFRRSYALAQVYGDLVDAWEIENEPDVFFADNVDVFAAFYKAVAFGLAAGRAQKVEAKERPRGDIFLASDRLPSASMVVMPALVLPPGPYLTGLLTNGFLSYTEGVNLHYYGFASDYLGAQMRLKDELTNGGLATHEQRASGGDAGVRRITQAVQRAAEPRRLSVFVSEWGYPRLDGYAAQTVEGRVRQWRYYRALTLQNELLRVRAPMAFYLFPFYEYGAKEFGLTMPTAEKRRAHFGFVVGGGAVPLGRVVGESESSPGTKNSGRTAEVPEAASASESKEATQAWAGTGGGRSEAEKRGRGQWFHAGGLSFSPADFGAKGPEKWMTRIGEEIGGNEASPAMAWMMDRAGRTVPPEFVRIGPRGRAERRYFRDRGDWLVRTEAPSPVVMDLIAGEGMQAVKSFCGYVLEGDMKGTAGGTRGGSAKLIFYHFGTEPAELLLAWPHGIGPARGEDQSPLRLKLEPGDRREVDVALSVADGAFRENDISLVAEVQSGGVRTRSRWATRLYPHPLGMASADARSFVFPANTASGNRDWLLREQVAEEAKVVAQGRWLVTPGVVVDETPTRWRFHVSALPPEPMRPARAELPLPDDWAPWERGLVMGFAYRSLPEDGAPALRADDPDPLRRLRTGKLGDTLEFFLRTRAGNVYCMQSPARPTAEWAPYNQPAETLTPGFPGRQAAPLKIDKERPASLVFFFRPAALPTIYEIDRPQLAHWRKPE